MNTPTTISTQALAALAKTTTNVVRENLDKAGIKHVSEYTTGSGRRYTLWGSDAHSIISAWRSTMDARATARKAKASAAKLRKVVKATKEPVAAPVPTPVADLSIPLLNQLLVRVAELQNDIRALNSRVAGLQPSFLQRPSPWPNGVSSQQLTAAAPLTGYPLPVNLSLHDDAGHEVLTR